MCNNLLQFAHVYAWGREHGRRVISMRFSYKYPYFKISHSRYVSFPLYVLAKALAALKVLPTASYKHAECDPVALEQKMLRHRHIVVSGWYVHFYDLFLKYRDEICDLFTIEPQYTEPVKAKMKAWTGLRLGVHIRRGDYRNFQGGRFLYSDEQYLNVIRSFLSLFPQQQVHLYICGNDPHLDKEYYLQQLPACQVTFPDGNPGEDLCLLSHCDYLIGAPSTFSLVAAMYRDLPLYWVEDPTLQVSQDSFKHFDYLFRHIY
jgi:hypothetical protein